MPQKYAVPVQTPFTNVAKPCKSVALQHFCNALQHFCNRKLFILLLLLPFRSDGQQKKASASHCLQDGTRHSPHETAATSLRERHVEDGAGRVLRLDDIFQLFHNVRMLHGHVVVFVQVGGQVV